MEANRVQITIPGLTERQKQMLGHQARIVHIGTGTKTGKTFGLSCWIAEGITAAERCCWVGPWYPRVRAAFEIIKAVLKPLIDAGEVQVTESLLRVRSGNGGGLDFYSADNYMGIYGGNYSRAVVDEASRCPAAVWPAVLTTISATKGSARASFNLELGSKNWAIRNLLRVQAMTPEERKAASEDFLLFPTGGDGLVDPVVIDGMRAQMPEPLWRALYLAEIPTEDVALFRNLDAIFTGTELESPAEHHDYLAGIDLGRKQDFTVVTIIDSQTGSVVATDRFHLMSWALQCERAAALYKKFRCRKAWVDATGIGDPVTEALSQLGVTVKAFVFTGPSRKSLLETLILACDRREITLPGAEKFLNYRQELESFEYQLDGSTVKYAVPEHMHDDCAMSLALATLGFKSGALGGIFQWYREQAEALNRPANPNPQTAEEKFTTQAAAGMAEARRSNAVVSRAFGADVPGKQPTINEKSKTAAGPTCPDCGKSLSVSGLPGAMANRRERCGSCGYERIVAGGK